MERTSKIERKTKETDIKAALSLDASESVNDIRTGIGFFDHMLNSFAFHAGFGLSISVTGDIHVDGHHTVEDAGIVLGKAFKEALGSMCGLRRFGSAFIPMDEALGFAAVDLSGRPFLAYDAVMPQELIGDYDSCLTEEFMRAFAMSAGITLHLRAHCGNNAHHVTEALFKALARALRDAVKIDGADMPSTKGTL